MIGPAHAIDLPTPYDPPEVWWAFLLRLKELNPNDPAVQDVRREAVRQLVVENHHNGES